MTRLCRVFVGAVLAVSTVLLLSACGSLSSANQYSGVNYAKAEFSGNGQLREIVFAGGKESGLVDLMVDLGNGAKAQFKGSDVRAFDGQAVRAAVEKAQAEVVGEVAPDLTDAIMERLLPLLF